MPSGLSRWVFVKIGRETCYLWLAVDHEGEVVEEVVTKRRDKTAALKLLRKLLKRHGQPASIVTEKLRSYGAALKELGLEGRQASEGRWIKNRAENSHLPLRRRERAILRFRSMRSLQKFASVHSSVHNHPSGQARRQASTSNATSTPETISKKTAPPPSPSGGNFWRHRAGHVRQTETVSHSSGSTLLLHGVLPMSASPPRAGMRYLCEAARN